MIFYSIAFLIFFLFFSVLLQKIKTTRGQHGILLLANIVFYSYWDYRFLLLLAYVIGSCYILGILYDKHKRNLWISLGVISGLVILGFFKYFNFFVQTFSNAFGIRDYVTLHLILPLGISFYLFQAISYLLDVQKGKIEAEKDLLKLAVYISFFPQITSGPIVKARDFLPQLDRIHRINSKNVQEGLQLFLTGLTKKLVFADRIGVAVDAVYQAPGAYSSISVLAAIVSYSLQIYCDFSGYSDMAIGIAKVWDFDLGENFNMPYLAKNPSEFWSRWHISLSSWFKEYVYIPLGGNRKGKIRTYLNLMFTMILSGLWHGANMTFVLWGSMHGLGSVLQKLFYRKKAQDKKEQNRYILSDVSIVANFIFVSLAWVLFRADSVSHALSIFRRVLPCTGVFYINVYAVIFMFLFIVIHIIALKKNNGQAIKINLDLGSFKNKVLIAVWSWAIVMLMYCGNSAFIYANF